jgi:hypothetical protein
MSDEHMKKQTKMAILVVFLALTMFGSSAAFIIVSGFAPPQQSQQERKAPERFVVDGYVDFASHDSYLSQGYTLLEFHYQEGCCPELIANVEALPAELEFQMVVQKVPDTKNYFVAESFRGRRQFNATGVLEVLFGLCDVLASPPPDCAFREEPVNSTQ